MQEGVGLGRVGGGRAPRWRCFGSRREAGFQPRSVLHLCQIKIKNEASRLVLFWGLWSRLWPCGGRYFPGTPPAPGRQLQAVPTAQGTRRDRQHRRGTLTLPPLSQLPRWQVTTRRPKWALPKVQTQVSLFPPPVGASPVGAACFQGTGNACRHRAAWQLPPAGPKHTPLLHPPLSDQDSGGSANKHHFSLCSPTVNRSRVRRPTVHYRAFWHRHVPVAGSPDPPAVLFGSGREDEPAPAPNPATPQHPGLQRGLASDPAWEEAPQA